MQISAFISSQAKIKGFGLRKILEGLGLGLVSDWKSEALIFSGSRAAKSRLYPEVHVLCNN